MHQIFASKNDKLKTSIPWSSIKFSSIFHHKLDSILSIFHSSCSKCFWYLPLTRSSSVHLTWYEKKRSATLTKRYTIRDGLFFRNKPHPTPFGWSINKCNSKYWSFELGRTQTHLGKCTVFAGYSESSIFWDFDLDSQLNLQVIFFCKIIIISSAKICNKSRNTLINHSDQQFPIIPAGIGTRHSLENSVSLVWIGQQNCNQCTPELRHITKGAVNRNLLRCNNLRQPRTRLLCVCVCVCTFPVSQFRNDFCQLDGEGYTNFRNQA